MPTEVIQALYCPECSTGADVDTGSVLKDNGWVIHFDMEVARLYGRKLPVHDMQNLSPETLFDKGYATWRGVYPGDHIDSVREREELARLAKTDPKKYFQEMKSWAISRMDRLKKEGWRKAYEG